MKIFTVKYNIALFISALVLTFGFFVARALTIPQVTIPDQPYSFDTSLSQSMTTSQTSMTLVSGTLKDGTVLSGYQCFTIDIGLTTAEYTCGTASGTVISNLVRGVPPLTPTTTNVSLEFAHRVGADVRITDFPGLQILKRLANGQDPYPFPLSYDQSVSTSTIAGNTQNLVDVGLLQSTVLTGALNATTTIQGLVQAGTITQIAGSVQNGSTGAVLFAPASLYASSSPSTQIIPVTQTNGKLNQNFLDLTANYTWSGLQTFNSATTTLNSTTSIAASASNRLLLNGVPYTFPSTQGVASTTLTNNGSGVLSFNPIMSFATATTTLINSSSVTTATITLASLIYTPSSAERLYLNGVLYSTAGNGNQCNEFLYIDGVSVGTLAESLATASGNLIFPMNFTYVTSQLSTAQHTLSIVASSGGTYNCNYTLTQFAAFNAGN